MSSTLRIAVADDEPDMREYFQKGLRRLGHNVVGAATLHLQGCDRATIAYRFDAVRIAGPFAGRRGTLDLKRMGGCAP